MQFVEEIVVEEFLPTVRSMLAEALRDRGLTQTDIAAVLGISQSAVSKYAHGEVTRNERIETDERVAELVTELADGLAAGDTSRVGALVELEVLIRDLERGGDLLARLHEEAVPGLADHDYQARIHDPDSGLRTNEAVLRSVRRGLRILENTSGFAALIPAVGSNLVGATPAATGVEDVAGVPGRIFDVKGRATVPGPPEFGVSEHVATVLLAARAGGADVEAAVNVRYDPDLLESLESLGHELVAFDETGDVAESVRQAVETQSEATVVYQTGGVGIEPITYVLGPTPESVAETIRSLLET